MLIAEYTVNQCMYVNISCNCKKNTANYLKVGHKLLGLTLKVNP